MPEEKPSIEIHGFANTLYTATYTYTYAGRSFEFKKSISTGDYTQAEGLAELQLHEGSNNIVLDKYGNVLEINMEASRAGILFEYVDSRPALAAFKKLRKLNLNGSSIRNIPKLFGDAYQDLEVLTMVNTVHSNYVPDSFGKLTKLKVFSISPMYEGLENSEMMLPSSFGNLKSLESFNVEYLGYVNFNGTLGQLTALKEMQAPVEVLPNDVGKLKLLKKLILRSKSPFFPQEIYGCKSLEVLNMTYNFNLNSDVVLASRIGELKNLHTIFLRTNNLRQLPASITALPALRMLTIEGAGLEVLPENIGSLKTLEHLYLDGSFTSIPESLGSLSRLKTLNLYGRQTGLPESFGRLSALTFLSMERTLLKYLPQSIGQLKNLQELNLHQTEIESLPDSFSDLDELDILNLSSTKLKGFPKAIIPLKSIRIIRGNNTNMGDIPDEITKMKSGVHFELLFLTNLTLEHMEHIARISTGKVYNTSFGYFMT